MSEESRRDRAWIASRVALVAAVLVGLACATAEAHERWIKCRLTTPIDDAFFRQGPWHFGVHPTILRVGMNVAVVLGAFLVAWLLRKPIEEFFHRSVVRHVAGPPQRFLHQALCFATDRPVKNSYFHALGQWSIIFLLRSPGLILMYSAANDSLVMPSYPLDPPSASFFKFAQVVLAILILTQTLLPLCGAALFGTWLYLFRWGWMVAMDAIPVLTAAAVYMTLPWRSHRIAITELTPAQLRWARLFLGIAFIALGWLKIYNYHVIACVADNYPAVMSDPMIKLLAFGAEPGHPRETWIVAFGMAEVMSGFLLLVGAFTRLWCAIMIFVFAKLMLVDFGWDEVPHIYPIGALLALMLSNRLASELEPLEQAETRLAREGRTFHQLSVAAGPAIMICLLLIFPLLYAFTFLERSGV